MQMHFIRQLQPLGLGLLLATALPHAAIARFDTVERCFGYRVFDVNDRTVNLRRSPNGAIVSTVPNGTQVSDSPALPSMPQGSTWMPVVFQRQTVYVSTKLLYRAVYMAVDANDRSVNLRRQPNGTIIKALPNNTEVAFVAPQGDWLKVRLSSGEVGYISSKLLKRPSCF